MPRVSRAHHAGESTVLSRDQTLCASCALTLLEIKRTAIRCSRIFATTLERRGQLARNIGLQYRCWLTVLQLRTLLFLRLGHPPPATNCFRSPICRDRLDSMGMLSKQAKRSLPVFVIGRCCSRSRQFGRHHRRLLQNIGVHFCCCCHITLFSILSRGRPNPESRIGGGGEAPRGH